MPQPNQARLLESMLAIICGTKLWEDPIDAPNLFICHCGTLITTTFPVFKTSSLSEAGQNLTQNSIKEPQRCVVPVLTLILYPDISNIRIFKIIFSVALIWNSKIKKIRNGTKISIEILISKSVKGAEVFVFDELWGQILVLMLAISIRVQVSRQLWSFFPGECINLSYVL